MNPRYFLATMAVGAMALVNHAWAHGFAGDHRFISTLLIDDPNVADEASVPTFQFLPQDAGGGMASYNFNLGFELDKRLTERVLAAAKPGDGKGPAYISMEAQPRVDMAQFSGCDHLHSTDPDLHDRSVQLRLSANGQAVARHE